MAVRIPKPYALEIGLKQNSLIDVTIVDGKLVLEPVSEAKYTLDDLLANVTEDNLHHEVDTGSAVGIEVW